MGMLILRTDINTAQDFRIVKNSLKGSYQINKCTIDFGDMDKVVRVIGDKIETDGKESQLGFSVTVIRLTRKEQKL